VRLAIYDIHRKHENKNPPDGGFPRCEGEDRTPVRQLADISQELFIHY
jgi:hypothetical protein